MAIVGSILIGLFVAKQMIFSNITTDIVYGPNPNQRLDLYQPVRRLNKAAAVILIHGGGWVSGDKRDYRFIARHAAEKGVVAAAINYRLADGELENMWPAQLEDAQTALKWIFDHASNLAIDPDRVCISGNSAGGQIAVLLGAVSQSNSPRVACIVDEFGPADLIKFFQEPPENLFGAADSATIRHMMEKASPVNQITHQVPPTLIIQGSEDIVVKPEQSEALRTALTQALVQTTYFSFKGGHAFQGLSRSQYAAIQDLELDFIGKAASR